MLLRYHRDPLPVVEPVTAWNPENIPLFSLCHTTARLPNGWKDAEKTWFNRCDRPETVEYILGADYGSAMPWPALEAGWGYKQFAVNTKRKCAVDGWNATGRASTGQFLITVSDDIHPCKHWDTELLKFIPSMEGEHVLDVRTGGNDGLLTFSMLTRKYYERLARDHGYTEGFFYPQYVGMAADDDFTFCAQMDRVIINARRLLFQHFHPDYGTAKADATYEWQHRRQAFAIGRAILERRIKEGFRK